jgi:hypothetical protein
MPIKDIVPYSLKKTRSTAKEIGAAVAKGTGFLLLVAAPVFTSCSKDDIVPDMPVVPTRTSVIPFGNTDYSRAAFYPLQTTFPRSAVLDSADKKDVKFVELRATYDHPLSDGDGHYDYLSANGVRNFLNNVIIPVSNELGNKFRLGGEMDLNAVTYDATAAERVTLESYGITFIRLPENSVGNAIGASKTIGVVEYGGIPFILTDKKLAENAILTR